MSDRRLSFGGSVVSDSLRSVGFEIDTPGVMLVETQRPTVRPPDSVLAQSLWNVLPTGDFVRALDPYPKAMQARALARREVSRVNLRRARKVVCLTDFMAEATESFAGRDVEVAAVCLPADAERIHRQASGPAGNGTALVPGTVTWYKRPHDALTWLASRAADGMPSVHLAGNDDGSGCLESVQALADELSIELMHHPLGRDAMWEAVVESSVVLLPSALESLGFSLAEALWLGRDVVASPIPAHVELAERVGILPRWFEDAPDRLCVSAGVMSRAEIEPQWIRLGELLGLGSSD